MKHCPAPDGAEPVPAIAPAPTYAKIGVTPGWTDLRVVDAETGKAVSKVIEANAQEGWLVRFETKSGNLVRVGDDFSTIREERPIRIEWTATAKVAV